MISRNFFIYGLHLICVTAIIGAGLVNDTCHKILIREDITKKAAKLICSDTANVYDPKSQNGSYLMEDTGNWAGEMFACLCSCQLPSDLENGQILSKDRIYHGETLNYSCNEGYEKSIETKIVCYDGLLMTVPRYLETQNINIFTRQKSLPDWFAHKYDGKVFDLWVSESANWSIPDTELQKNQKVFQSFKNETCLQYYMCRGKGCMLGCVSLGMGRPDCISLGVRDLECKGNLAKTTTIVSSSHCLPGIIGGVAGGVASGVIILVIACCIKKKRQRTKKEGTKSTNQSQEDIKEEEQPMMQISDKNLETSGIALRTKEEGTKSTNQSKEDIKEEEKQPMMEISEKHLETSGIALRTTEEGTKSMNQSKEDIKEEEKQPVRKI